MNLYLKTASFLLNLYCIASLSSPVFANPVCSRMGALTVCGKGTLSDLHVAGKATLDGTTVLGKTEIAGMLTAQDVSLNKLKVSGKATLKNSQVKGKTKISGFLVSLHSKFYQKLTISSDKTHLSETYSRDIQISRGGDVQVLCLTNSTVVDGNIVFTSNHGVVVMDDSSKVKGRIIGGYIKQNVLSDGAPSASLSIQSYCEGEKQ